MVTTSVACPAGYGDPSATCPSTTQQVQVVDLANGGAKLRGTVTLPTNDYYGYGYYGGYYWYDWYDGASVVQVGGDALALRRWSYGPWLYDDGVSDGGVAFDATQNGLFVVDLSNPDAPSVAATPIAEDPTTWWGDLTAAGNTLYATHYEWEEQPSSDGSNGTVRYYLDQMDLSDRAHPKVGARINVPGVLVGASESDPSIIYTVDYYYDGTNAQNSLAALRVDGSVATLLGSVSVEGWVGNVFVRGSQAYLSSEYDWTDANGNYGSKVSLHQLELSNPSQPVDFVATDKQGWGWLLGVEGDRAIVTSGWGSDGVDIYRVAQGTAPTYDRFVRVHGDWTNSLSRQQNQIYLSSGYWGVQTIDLGAAN